jgi:hypothetical protein
MRFARAVKPLLRDRSNKCVLMRILVTGSAGFIGFHVVTNQIAIHPALFVADVTRFLDAEVPFPIQKRSTSGDSKTASRDPAAVRAPHPDIWRLWLPPMPSPDS